MKKKIIAAAVIIISAAAIMLHICGGYRNVDGIFAVKTEYTENNAVKTIKNISNDTVVFALTFRSFKADGEVCVTAYGGYLGEYTLAPGEKITVSCPVEVYSESGSISDSCYADVYFPEEFAGYHFMNGE